MRQIQNAFLVLVTLLIALGLALQEQSKELLGVSVLKSDPQTTPSIEPDMTVFDYIYEYSEQTLLVPEKEEASSEEKAPSGSVEASTSGQAVGKIKEQFLSPYSAKYSYNNVYLKNSSGLTVDIKSELAKSLSFKIEKKDQPEVLIMHTHATECYMKEDRDYYTSSDPSRTTDNEKNITHIGELVASRLEAGGIGVIHDRTQHDHPSYTGSYSRSEVTVNEYLKKYPSIKIVIDIHRDSISLNETDRVRPVAEIEGKPAAQVMLCMGSQSGTVKNHPNWRENLRLALRLQQTMEVMYPGLARPLVLASKLYNQNLTNGSILIEVGTESNTMEEAEYSAELLGNSLVNLLNTLR